MRHRLIIVRGGRSLSVATMVLWVVPHPQTFGEHIEGRAYRREIERHNALRVLGSPQQASE